MFCYRKIYVAFSLGCSRNTVPCGGGGADHSSQLVGHVCFVKDTKTRQVGTNGSPDPPSGIVETKIIFAIPLCNRGVGVKKVGV